jgi:hypothetical protein
MTWLPGYSKRKELPLTGGASGAQTDFQLQIAVSYEAAMQGDFDDIRFTQADGTTLIDAWAEVIVTDTSATVWVEFPTTPANTVEQTYYMYYGYAGVGSDWDGDATFEFFDDFNPDTLEDWRVENGYTTHCAIIKDGKYYTVRWDASTGQIMKINVSTGVKEDSLVVTRYAQSAPFISGNYLYSYISSGHIYKNNLSNFSDYTTQAVTFNDKTEATAFDDTYFYLAETGKISKRNLSDMVEVDSFACTNPRGVLRVGTTIYFITENGKFYAVATSDMTESWNLSLDYTTIKTYDVPIYDSTHNRIYIADSNTTRTGGHVYGINPTTQAEIWVKTYTGGITSTPVYYNNKLFFSVYNPSGTGTHKALDVSTDSPTETWSKQYHTDSAWGGFAADDTYLYTVTKHNSPYYFLIIRQSDGVMVHSEGVSDQKACNVPVLSDGRAIVGVLDNLYCFKVGTGSAVDSLYYHCDQNYTGHISNAITAYNPFSIGYVLTDKWTSVAGTWAVSSNILHQTATSGWCELQMKDYTNSGDFAIKMSFKAIDDKEVMFSLHHQDLDNYVQAQPRTANDKLRVIREISGAYQLWESGAVTINTGTWYDFETKILGLNYALELDSFSWNQTIDSDPGFDKLEIGVYAGAADFDNVFVRKYVANPPTYAFGSEESVPVDGAWYYEMLRRRNR